jgi:hypothetical protein
MLLDFKKSRVRCGRSATHQVLEHPLPRSADRALPVFREIFKRCTLGDLSFAITLIWIVDISTVRGLALIHGSKFLREIS